MIIYAIIPTLLHIGKISISSKQLEVAIMVNPYHNFARMKKKEILTYFIFALLSIITLTGHIPFLATF